MYDEKGLKIMKRPLEAARAMKGKEREEEIKQRKNG
jgi:hypothetical protein